MSDKSLVEATRKNAEGPAKAAAEGGPVEQHQLSEQIAVDRYLNSKKAVRSKRPGLRIYQTDSPRAS